MDLQQEKHQLSVETALRDGGKYETKLQDVSYLILGQRSGWKKGR